jgi:GTP cyclohydrolase I
VTERVNLSWRDVQLQAQRIAERVNGSTSVWGVPRGGVPVACMVRAFRPDLELVDEPGIGTLVVDDVVDSGLTLKRYAGGWAVDALYRKPSAPAELAPAAGEASGWLHFPWEADETGPEDAVVRLLSFIGEDPSRDGLRETPRRVVASLAEFTAGYDEDPAKLLAVTFEEHCDEMVVVRGVEFTSMCEHHLLPFVGYASVAYVPDQRVVGLSKLARLVDLFARRLQVQERMTVQIADAIETNLQPRGVGVLLRARHSCMGCRGVRKPEAEMVTSALSGFMRDDPKARAEFLALADGH